MYDVIYSYVKINRCYSEQTVAVKQMNTPLHTTYIHFWSLMLKDIEDDTVKYFQYYLVPFPNPSPPFYSTPIIKIIM